MLRQSHETESRGQGELSLEIVFFEKPGCLNNTRQKKWLEEAGHRLRACSLLTHPWSPEELRLFLGQLPVAQWFNRSAPALKNGSVVPEALSAEEALALLVAEPLLIRRPLIARGNERHVGFDIEAVHAWLGLPLRVVEQQREQNAESCLRHE